MAFGKQPLDWLELIEGLTYVAAIKKIFLTERDKPIIARQDGEPHEQGVWLHPRLAIHFTGWPHPEFLAWCDMQVEEILR